MNKNKLTLLSLAFTGWWFLNTWPGAKYPTALGPFRTLSQCTKLKLDPSLTGAKKSPCHSNAEPPISAWWFFYKTETLVPTTGDGFPDQQTCEQRRLIEVNDGQEVSATCWPSF